MENLLDTYNNTIQCLEKFLGAFQNEVLLKNSNLTTSFDHSLEAGLHTTAILCFLSETFFSKAMRKDSRHCTVMLYVPKRLLKRNSLRRYQKRDHMTLLFSHIEANMGKCAKLWNLTFDETARGRSLPSNWNFWVKLHFERLREIFLGTVWCCCRYLKGSPSVALYNGNKIIIIWHFNPWIL